MKQTILVIREPGEFCRILAANGYKTENLPLIATEIADDLSDFENKLSHLENYDGVFLTSAKAAQIFAGKLSEKNLEFKDKVYVLGKRGFEILSSGNLDLVFDKAANTAREFLENIATDELKNKRFLFIRGENSLRVVPDFLVKIAEVDETVVYETREIAPGIDKINRIREMFAADEIAAACFFSPSGAGSFLKQCGEEFLQKTAIAVIGKTTAGFFERRRMKVDFISPKADAQVFAFELVKFLENEKRKTDNE